MTRSDPFGAKATLETAAGTVVYYQLSRLAEQGVSDPSRLPFSIRVLLENLLRHCDGSLVTEEDVLALARWAPRDLPDREIPFMPARVILQDFTGVPAVVDLAAMRSAVKRLGGDPRRINPLVPADLVIDHSVQVDFFGTELAFYLNVEKEFERNRERYALLRWAQKAFRNFRVVPPGTGIVHQVNLEYLAKVVQTRGVNGEVVAFPDTLVGTDSHTTMINALGVLGWGVGGIEAEAVMLGQPYYMRIPEVIGVRLTGHLPEGATATDLVLTITQLLRKKGVVDKFVEFFGPGLRALSLPDRATIANMAPEYGATCGFFPVDEETLAYLRGTGREPDLVDLVERYTKAQGLFYDGQGPDPLYTDVVELDLGAIEPTLAGPRRPHDRVPLREVKRQFWESIASMLPPLNPAQAQAVGRLEGEGGVVAPAPAATAAPSAPAIWVSLDGQTVTLGHGAVVIAAITSCTNTSNPSVMIGAGLLARNAVKRGLMVKPYVKTSLAPGSPVVVDYLRRAGLLPYLEALRFHLVGFGCTTCIGNSGPLPEPIAKAIREHNLVAVAVLSGNRNFEARIHPLVRANYLASPMLVVAYALAGRIDIDFEREPIGFDPNGQPVFLRDIWPSPEEIQGVIRESLDPEMFRARYARVFEGDERWRSLPVPEGDLYEWDPDSTYIQEPPFFREFSLEPPPLQDIRGARVLAVLGDTVTTDHISPAGSIPVNSPAGQYLIARGVPPADFNTYGARRGNHEVMIRGTFANIRLKNMLVPGTEGGYTVYHPTGERMTIYEAAMRYQEVGIPLIILAGKEYGSGSSRDWAAKGTALLGVKAVLAESFERIHRSNLVGMGVLPLQFRPGENRESLGLTGFEIYDIEGIAQGLRPRQEVIVRARRADGTEIAFPAIARLDTPVEVEYYRHGGILPAVLRRILQEAS
ncbi:aconitate hydratase AcnA [Thermoflexus hugenholtzii]|uniref:Aconitate hydratase n=1 Tax=Thermoflexus hugenholtzii JAD2 TaxID=877466 RepID=A0A212QWV7_9CHLR|nr:aconitate hydratase AcnA [Thermoflexus hugenholtzii]SNB64103.1 aconitate hydratase [Thermoflexus hugenholtzii JAD2]